MVMNKKNLIFIVLLLVAATVFSFTRGDYNITMSFQDDTFTLDGPQGMVFSAPFDDITHVVLAGDKFDKGTQLTGETKYGFTYGEYENAYLGRYTLCTRTKLTEYIVVTVSDGRTLVYNCESNELTKKVQEQFADLISQR